MDFDPSAGSADVLGLYSVISIHNIHKSCVTRFLKCDSTNEFVLSEQETKSRIIFTASETSSCCCRLTTCRQRFFSVDVKSGSSSRGPLILSLKRNWKCCFIPCKCCYRENVIVSNYSGKMLGSVNESMWYCVPEFEIIPTSQPKRFTIRRPTCCGGICINCFRDGCNHVPFYIYDTDSKREVGKLEPQIRQQPNAYRVEGTSTVAEIQFPADSNASEKAIILASYFLINMLFIQNSCH